MIKIIFSSITSMLIFFTKKGSISAAGDLCRQYDLAKRNAIKVMGQIISRSNGFG